jgi:hypothetical protein
VLFKHPENEFEPQPDNNNNTRQMLTVFFGLEIPEKYYRCPIISNLIAHFDLEVNILAAFLGKTTERRGWFDLELRGTAEQIDSALIYLSIIDIPLRNLQISR